jgi:dTDP-4-dehydrorhamnose reductase
MNIIIIGANGQLGLALQKQYPQAQTVDAAELDITDPMAVNSFDWTGIDTIINAAAYTNVDGAETDQGRIAAWNVNASAVKNLSAIARKLNARLIHISTDYVFDGTAETHTEEEPFSPLSVYGQSKAAGDIAASLTPKHYILRTSWVIGEGKNFVRTMMSLAEKNISPSVVSDQIGRLTFTSELVRGIDHLLQNSCEYGSYNLSNAGKPVSWADITRSIFKIMRSGCTVTGVTTSDYYKGKSGIAPRPLNSMLSLRKLEKTGFSPNDWKTELTEYVQNEQKTGNA